MTIGERDMQGSVIALKAAPKLHNYNSTRNKNSDTQKYTYIMHIKKHTHHYMTQICRINNLNDERMVVSTSQRYI